MTALPPLKRCPFCGGAADIEEVPSGIGRTDSVTFTVGCTEDDGGTMCMGYQSLTTFPTRREAIEAWNKRAPAVETALTTTQ